MRGNLNIVTALPAEAEPLIARFLLKKYSNGPSVPLFSNPSGTIRLAVSGVGKKRAQEAVSALADCTPSPDRSIWINAGIAGHRDLPVGTPVLAGRIKDEATGQSWDLDPPFDPPCRIASVTTVERPVETFHNGDVYDMEASGFYSAASRIAPRERVHVIKIISDNHRSPIRNISRTGVTELVTRNLPVVAKLARLLGRLRAPQRLNSLAHETLYGSLDTDLRDFIRDIGLTCGLTFQELRQVMEIAIDFKMWGEPSLKRQWRELEERLGPPGTAGKEIFLKAIRRRWQTFREQETVYDRSEQTKPVISGLARKKLQVRLGSNGVYGICPVASEKTVCCNLRTIDAVQGCGFGCTYCSIQTFYDPDKIAVDAALGEKLRSIKLDPRKRYHIGSGQSSDSLLLGNREGVLEAQLEFARRNPNVVLEFKTKSKNVAHLLSVDVPPNVFVSWSLNPQVIIEHEELRTASLEERLAAARRVADRGIRVGFHFHPIIHYRGYRDDYENLIDTLVNRFSPDEVAFVSFGTLTFIKPAVRSLRQQGVPSKVLQIPMEEAAGKLSYPMPMKEEMFAMAWQAFHPWHGRVFFYLCMEARELWEKTFGFCYGSNEAFEEAMLDALFRKLDLPLPWLTS